MKKYRGLETTSEQSKQLEVLLHDLFDYCKNIILDDYSKKTIKKLINDLIKLIGMYDATKVELILTIIFTEIHEDIHILK